MSPQTEEKAFNPQSAYGFLKLFAHYIVQYYRKRYCLFLTTGILFNHESPLRGEEFLTKKIVGDLNKIALGEIEKVYIG